MKPFGCFEYSLKQFTFPHIWVLNPEKYLFKTIPLLKSMQTDIKNVNSKNRY